MQSEASSLPVASIYLPTTQSRQSDASSFTMPYTLQVGTQWSPHAESPNPMVLQKLSVSMYFPATQLMQSEASLLPVTSMYLPATQSIQSDSASLPGTFKYFPATQPIQSVAASLPVTSTYLPATQPTQCPIETLPEVVEYLPAAQSMQSEAWSLPDTSTYVPAWQSMQLEGEALPAAVEYLPMPQLVHCASAVPPALSMSLVKYLKFAGPPQSSPTALSVGHPEEVVKVLAEQDEMFELPPAQWTEPSSYVRLPSVVS